MLSYSLAFVCKLVLISTALFFWAFSALMESIFKILNFLRRFTGRWPIIDRIFCEFATTFETIGCMVGGGLLLIPPGLLFIFHTFQFCERVCAAFTGLLINVLKDLTMFMIFLIRKVLKKETIANLQSDRGNIPASKTIGIVIICIQLVPKNLEENRRASVNHNKYNRRFKKTKKPARL